MSRTIHVEPDEDITDLVEHIRESGDETELVFVLPTKTSALRSPLKLRLLQQYSRAASKRASIVTADPQLQGLALRTGLPTYASVQALERGIPVTQPPALEPVAVGVTAGAAADAAAPPTVRDRPASAPASDPWYAPALPPVDQPPAGPARPTRTPPPRRGISRYRYYYTAGALFIVGLLLLFLVAPSATVKITLRATPLNMTKLIQGTTDATAAAGPDHILTQVVTADAADKFTAKPTGTKAIPAETASGNVVLKTDRAIGACVTGIKKGATSFTTGTSPPIVFIVAADIAPSPQCLPGSAFYIPPGNGKPGGYGPPSSPIPITAQTPGASGNVAAGAINSFPGNPDSPDTIVTNLDPTSGGVDQHNITIVSDQDLAQFKAQAEDIRKRLAEKVKGDMQAKAPGKVFAIDPAQNGVTVSADVNPALPNSGDQYAPADITVNVHGKATMYNPNDVRDVINKDVLASVPKNETLASNPPPEIPAPKITQAGDDGIVVFSATERAFTHPIVDVQRLKDRFAGKSRSTVRQVAAESLGSQVEAVDVSQTIPFFVLPLFSSRVDVQLEVVATPAKTP
jgi:hypothetical protein